MKRPSSRALLALTLATLSLVAGCGEGKEEPAPGASPEALVSEAYEAGMRVPVPVER